MNFIKSYWENQAKTHKSSHNASWGDIWAIELEIDTIGKYIKPGNLVLDAGCGNGFSTLAQAKLEPKAEFEGIDYAKNMIEYAKIAKAKRKDKCKVSFSVGSILDIPFDDNMFDVVYTTRVLINLPNWEDQKKAIKECLRVTKPKGKVILSEGFWEPLCLLNAIRQLKQMPPLIEHDFNRYLKKEKLETYLKQKRWEFLVEDFASVYYLGTRFLRDILLDKLPPVGDYNSPVNKAFYELEKQFSGGGFGIQQAYVITKP